MDFVPTDISSLPKIDKKIMVSAKPMPVRNHIKILLNKKVKIILFKV